MKVRDRLVSPEAEALDRGQPGIKKKQIRGNFN